MDPDKSDLHSFLSEFPRQLAEGLKLGTFSVSGRFKKTILNGMGGSALPGLILRDLEPQLNVVINRDYCLPRTEGDLVILSSYSGNTVETISCMEEAIKKGEKMFSITSGGRILELSKNHSIPYVLIPKVPQPRFAVGYVYGSLVSVLFNSKIIQDPSSEIQDAVGFLENQDYENQGKELAEKLQASIPVVYTSSREESLGYIWKISFNENSKMMAFSNVFPELNHNELSGYIHAAKQGNFHFLIILDKRPEIEKRMRLTADLLAERKSKVTTLELPNKNKYARMFGGILLGYWTSYYLALKNGIDPTPIEMQEEFKKRLKI